MKKMIVFVLFLMSIHTYGNGNAGILSADISEGARAISMGESFTGYSGDVYAQFWNPSAIYGRNTISFTHINIFEGIKSEFLISSFPLKIGKIGFYMHYIGYGEFNGLDEHARNPYTFTAADYDVNLNYAFRMKKRLHLGISFKYAHSNIDTTNAHIYAVSFGGLYFLKGGMLLGVSLRNIGTKGTFYNDGYALPEIFSLGFSKRMKKMLYTGDIEFRTDDRPQLGIGMEYRIKFFHLRVGLKTEKDLGLLSLLRFGFGIKKQPVQFDYAVIPSGDLGIQQIASLGVEF